MNATYFVTVIAPDRAALGRLAAYDLDLLHQTAARTERRTTRLTADLHEAKPPEVSLQASIDGLLTLDQVARLVKDGYQVLVREDASKRSRATQTMPFQDWLKAVLEN